MDKFIDSFDFSYFKRKAFVLSFVSVFTVVTLQYLGFKAPHLLNPVATVQSVTNKAELAQQQLFTKLEEKPNDFKVVATTTFGQPEILGEDTYGSASAYTVIDYTTGQVLAEKAGTQSLPMASLTKVMTAVVTLDLASPGDMFVVSEHAANTEPTAIGVVPGDKMSVSELLFASLMTSANDAVAVLQEGIDAKHGAGTFIAAMNRKAQYIGMTKSHFTNPQGFDNPNHYSSVQDLALLSHYALNNYPLIAEIVKKDYLFIPETSTHKQFDLYNWNGLLDVYPNIFGIKIGNTHKAQTTTIVAAERNGQKILAVVLGAPGILQRDLWASQLLDLGFEKKLGLAKVNVSEAQLKEKYRSWKFWN